MGWKLLSTVTRYLFISRSSSNRAFSTSSRRSVGSWPAERLRARPSTVAVILAARLLAARIFSNDFSRVAVSL